MADTRLTSAQSRYLAEIRAAGPEGRSYNGHAKRTLEALERLGLIKFDLDLVPHADAYGNIGSFTYRLTARAVTAQGKEQP